MTKNPLPVPATNQPTLSWWRLGAIFVLLASGLTLIFSALTPKTQTSLPQTEFMVTNFNDTQSNFKNLKFTGTPITLPEKLPIVTLVVDPTIAQQAAQKLIETYNLNPHALSQNLWTKDIFSLFRDQRREEYVFAQDVSITQTPENPEGLNTETKIIAINQAQQAASQFMTAVLPLNNYTRLDGQTRYFNPLRKEFEEVIPAVATAVEFGYAPLIQGFPLVNGKSEYLPVRLMVNSHDQVVKASFAFRMYRTQELRELPTISIPAALEQIKDGTGSLISAYAPKIHPPSLANIRSGTLTAVRLEYRTDDASGVAYPTYVFSGQIINQDGVEIDAQIMTPAVVVQAQVPQKP